MKPAATSDLEPAAPGTFFNIQVMHVIIPARYGSSRLPGKPLADICGKSLVQRVYERACESGAESVVIATDDERIRDAAEKFGARVCLTSGRHRSGTERIAEVVEKLCIPGDQIVVNVQGDEPDMSAALIRRVADTLSSYPRAVMATACCPVVDETDYNDPDVVKVVCDKEGYALYFSRAPIPFRRNNRHGLAVAAMRHIGLYAYRAVFLARYVSWPPCAIEETEQLEQLRVIWHGERIAVCRVRPEEAPSIAVDAPPDLERARRYFEKISAG